MSGTPAKRWLAFIGSITAMAGVWTIALPWVATQPAVKQHIEFMESKGVDPSALYYTDLEVIGQIRANVSEKRQSAPEAFWTKSIRYLVGDEG